jgi:cytochrome c oxidase assembly protein subunit 15
VGVKHPDRRVVLRWARASVVANIAIVLTGGLVRLTDSGLGCPTWPKCTRQTWTAHEALGIHGVIEFGNRLLTYVLVAVAVMTLVAVWRWSESNRTLRRLAIGLLAGIPLQGVIGGFTVLTHLNPWLVALHLVLSMMLIAGAAVLTVRVSGVSPGPIPPAARSSVAVLVVLVATAVYLGTIVTGSGPHAGDAIAPRNGLDPVLVSHVHAIAVYLLLAATVASVLLLRDTSGRTAAWLVLGVEVLQAGLGIAQYNLGLPVTLVAAHLVGAGLLVAATAALAARIWPQPVAT